MQATYPYLGDHIPYRVVSDAYFNVVQMSAANEWGGAAIGISYVIRLKSCILTHNLRLRRRIRAIIRLNWRNEWPSG